MRTCVTISLILISMGFHVPTVGIAQDKPPAAKWEYANLRAPSNPKDPQHFTWVTEKEDVIGDGWKEFAERMKFEIKEPSTDFTKARIQLLNQFGAKGWELVSSTEPGQTRYLFKRRIP